MVNLIKPKHIEPLPSGLPDQQEIAKTREYLSSYINKTPVLQIPNVKELSNIYLKMEVWQPAGSFKIRGALTSLLNLTEKQRNKGVITASAGNHALSLSYAASIIKTNVKVVMPKSADISRVKKCKDLGAEVVFADSFPELFKLVKEYQQSENRVLVHPFDGRSVSLGTATLGVELIEQLPDLEAVIIAVGGGGLLSGVSYAIKQINSKCKIFGVEPEGAQTLASSFNAGKIMPLDEINTIAQSLSAPKAEEFSYAICTNFVDGIAVVSDEQIKQSMCMLFETMGIAVEPAAAAGLAGAVGPLKDHIKNKKTAIILCGSNMGIDEFCQLIKKTKK